MIQLLSFLKHSVLLSDEHLTETFSISASILHELGRSLALGSLCGATQVHPGPRPGIAGPPQYLGSTQFSFGPVWQKQHRAVVLPDTSPPWQPQMSGHRLPLCPVCCRGDGAVSIYTTTRAPWTHQCLHRYQNVASLTQCGLCCGQTNDPIWGLKPPLLVPDPDLESLQCTAL